jgi:hypothetical protein
MRNSMPGNWMPLLMLPSQITKQAGRKSCKSLYQPIVWSAYEALLKSVQELADQNYEILKTNPRHLSLHLKKVERYWAVRMDLHYRALSVEVEDGLLWFWIGSHAEYDRLIQ